MTAPLESSHAPGGPASHALDAPPGQDSAELRSYTRTKHAVARAIRALSESFRQRGDEARQTACRELMVKLAEDRFTLAVVGQFKRGKSSLMNALVGREVLPTGVLPLTSAITILRFGPRQRLLIPRPGDLFPEEAPVASLPDYVTEKGNPGNRKKVTAVYLELPVPFLRRGLEFVDTPGVGSAIAANTQTTHDFLPKCDAVLFVTSVDTPLTTVETEFLSRLRQHVRKIFFVVNKIDLLGQQERQEVLAYVRDTLQTQMGAAAVSTFEVSSRLGLQAKLSGNADGYASSGLAALENALASFLTSERRSTFLTAILDKALSLLAAQARQIELRQRLQAASEETRQQLLSQLRARLDGADQHRRATVSQLRERALKLTADFVAPAARSFVSDTTTQWTSHLRSQLARARWEFSGAAARRLATAATDDLRAAASAWAAAQPARLTAELAPLLGSAVQELNQQISALPRIVQELLGDSVASVPAVAESQDKPSPPPLPPPALSEIQWTPHLPRMRACLPVAWTRRWLQDSLDVQMAKTLRAWSASASQAFQTTVNQAIDTLSTDVASRASQAQSALLAALMPTGHAEPSQPPNPQGATPTLADWLKELATLETRFVRLQQVIARSSPLPATLPQPPAPEPRQETVPQVAAAQTVPASPDLDWPAALKTRGCPVCNGLSDVLFDFLAKWQRQFAIDEQVQQTFAVEGGFCPLHTWQLLSLASPQGLSLGYPKFLERASQEIAELDPDSPHLAESLAAKVASPSQCRVCQWLKTHEQQFIARLTAWLQDPRAPAAYARSQGVCLRHLRQLLVAVTDTEIRRFLLAQAARHFEELSEDMQNYAIKHDAIRRALHTRDEEDAYLRAAIHLVGDRSLCLPWSQEIEI